MPSAKPNSELVSPIAAAAPAFSGVAAPTMSPVPRVTSGAQPRFIMPKPRITLTRPELALAVPIIKKPIAAKTRPAPMR